MYILGILLLLIGAVLKIWVKLSTREEMRALTPQNVLMRRQEVELIQNKKYLGRVDSTILIVLGIVFTAIAALFN